MPEKINNINKQKVVKKATIKKKSDELLTSKYEPKKGEKLIVDKPSTPLLKKETPIIKKVVEAKSNKELYESYIKDLNNFKLSINGEVMYDSKIDKSNITPLSFGTDFFVLYGKKYSYNGLRIQKIN